MRGRERLEIPDLDPAGLRPGERRFVVKEAVGVPQQKPRIQHVANSELLAKLRGFLPEMERSNKELESAMKGRPREEFDIEAVDPQGAEQHIEMDLGVGVLELRDQAAVRAAERDLAQRVVSVGGEELSGWDLDSESENSDLGQRDPGASPASQNDDGTASGPSASTAPPSSPGAGRGARPRSEGKPGERERSAGARRPAGRQRSTGHESRDGRRRQSSQGSGRRRHPGIVELD
ncbi:unnamed protein product [Pedinophyceae sp. YPF-701]|nr:unnamed protein product [Pedinophyceae sp. YPF-701]